MTRIDPQTVDRILDAADIVEVVSDFVSLKKRGANYWGLCPFHNDRSPSFSVNPARGIFKCFSCGKAGGTVSFLMSLENMKYVEALKWLARKYNIEIRERELTTAERQAQAERESMYAANEFALKYFESTMADTAEGRNVGLAYFRERGINDAMIQRFHLGYSLEANDGLLRAARAAGFEDRILTDTGLCIRNERGSIYDRFRARVIYPVHSLSGRVVAFGGRILNKEKSPAKYVNSPESIIYSKSNELYGMYQARNAIVRKKKCILVEGYMDVISMHQVGVENVVASSGTSLTEGQVRMIKRFAPAVTLIYDSDAAGIKAALRGIDMFVAAGLSLKVVLLPDGDDPDSFAQSHSATEVEQYIEEHEQDLIGFKTDILMKDADRDPRARSEAINDILRTISMIPNIVERELYIDMCANKVGIGARTLAAQVGRILSQREADEAKRRTGRTAEQTVQQVQREEDAAAAAEAGTAIAAPSAQHTAIVRAEEDLMRYILRHGALFLCEVYTDPDSDEPVPMTVYEYIRCELQADSIEISEPRLHALWELVRDIYTNRWPGELDEFRRQTESRIAALHAEGLEEIRQRARDMASIEVMETDLNNRLEAERRRSEDEFAGEFIQRMLLRHQDKDVNELVARITSERAVLSRMYPQVDVREDLLEKVPRAIFTLKSAIVKDRLARLEAELGAIGSDNLDKAFAIMKEIKDLKQVSMEFDKTNGEIVITPHINKSK